MKGEAQTALEAASGRRDLSISLGPASVYGPLMLAPLVLAFCSVFYLIWGFKAMKSSEFSSLVFASLIGIAIHELLHTIAWVMLGKKPWRSIKFGFLLSALAPYAHCTEPLEVSVYRQSVALPGLALGVLPMLLSVFSSSVWLLVFGALFTFAAGGDALILWLIRDVKSGALIEDHLTRAGCYVLDSPPPFTADF